MSFILRKSSLRVEAGIYGGLGRGGGGVEGRGGGWGKEEEGHLRLRENMKPASATDRLKPQFSNILIFM